MTTLDQTNWLDDQPVLVRTATRSRRVIMLLVLVIILNLADLYNTLTYFNSIGMVELNPIANYLLNSGSNLALVLFKLGAMGIAVGLLLKVRKYPVGELGSWVLAIMMTVLTIYWLHYTATLTEELRNASYPDVAKVMQALADAHAGQ